MIQRILGFLSKKISSLTLSAMLVLTFYSFGQQLPTATSIAAEMGFAWNIGNSLEVPNDPTAWGNPLPTQQLIDSIKAAGFKTIRIPCAWNSHADTNTNTIKTAWLAQVKAIVDYCIKDSLFVVLNSHWDGGWLEENISTAKQTNVKKRQGAYWRQIATAFRDYDRHLLFASANEPAVQDPYGTAFGDDRMAVLNSYHQTFIDSVRATGGNNTSRTLIVQGPRSDIELTYKIMTAMPTDKIDGRLMAECHFYPYQFCLMEQDADWGKVFYYWGQNNHSTTDTDRNSTWCEEKFVDSMFTILKKQFVDKDIPVLLGEFGAMKRMTLTGDTLKRHIKSRRSFYEYVLSSAKSHGIIPAAWDAGGKGNLTMTIFDRKTGAIFDLGLLNAIRSGWGLSKLPGDTSLVQTPTGNNALKVLYSCKDSLYGQIELGVVKKDMTTYDSIIVRTFVNGETRYDSAGISKNGYVNLNLVTMSKQWTWRQVPLGDMTMNEWENYSIPIGTDTTNKNALVPADPANIQFFALQVYSRGYHGSIYVDWIVFKSKSGISDTVYSFNMNAPEEGKGNIDAVKLIAVDNVSSDQEWKTATTTIWKPTSVVARIAKVRNSMHITTRNGVVRASWLSKAAGTMLMSLRDLQGKTIQSRLIDVKAGLNQLEIPARHHVMMILQIDQGDKQFTGKLIYR